MTTRIASFLIVAVLAISIPAPSAQADVEWSKSTFDDILKKAKKENKHVFIDFYAVWCSPCKRLEKITYRDPKVIEYLNGIIPAKYDAEKGDGKSIAEKFRVKAYPTLVLLDPSGKEIDRYLGYLDPKDFLETMQNYQKGIGTIQYYKEKLKNNPDDLELLNTLGTKYADALMAEEANMYLGEIVKRDPSNKRGFTDRAIFTLGQTFYQTDRWDEAEHQFMRLLEEFPQSKAYDDGLVLLARTYHRKEDEKKCLETYMRYVDRHPEDPKALNSFAWFCATRRVGLDQALPIAKKAAQLSNEAPGILDTLAELYYAMGDYEKAIEIEEKAASKDPEDIYLKDQIIKFLKAALEESKQGGKHAER